MMKFNRWMFLFGVFLLCIPLMAFERGLPEARITVKVVDEDGKAVSNAVVGIGFDQGGNAMAGRYKGENFKGLSDTNGLFSAQAKSTEAVGISVRKEGCYMSSKSMQIGIQGVRNGKWQPWNPTIEIMLKKIGNPVSMYAKRVQTPIPVDDTPVGYDLVKGDWVAPHGKGEQSDFIFRFHRHFQDMQNYQASLELTFSNEEDGIQELVLQKSNMVSKLRLPATAPLTGYKPNWKDKFSRSSSKTVFYGPELEEKNYFFRVRTVLDENKNIVSALYGKIHRHIGFGGVAVERGNVAFTYYLNPDGTRNLEFDPERNLFKDLGPFEKVSEP